MEALEIKKSMFSVEPHVQSKDGYLQELQKISSVSPAMHYVWKQSGSIRMERLLRQRLTSRAKDGWITARSPKIQSSVLLEKRNVSNAYALKVTLNTVFISRVPDGQTGQEPME